MRKNVCWFIGGMLLMCALGAGNAAFKSIMCEAVNASHHVSVGDITLTSDNGDQILMFGTPGKSSLIVALRKDGESFIIAESPKGKKVTQLSP